MVTRIWIFGALLGILSLPLHGATATAAVCRPPRPLKRLSSTT